MFGAKSFGASQPGTVASLAALMGLPSQAVSGGGRIHTGGYLEATGYGRKNNPGL